MATAPAIIKPNCRSVPFPARAATQPAPPTTVSSHGSPASTRARGPAWRSVWLRARSAEQMSQRTPARARVDDAEAGRTSRGARTWKGRRRRRGSEGGQGRCRVAVAGKAPRATSKSLQRLAPGARDGLRTWPVAPRIGSNQQALKDKVSLGHVVVASRRRGAAGYTVPDTSVSRPAALSSRAWS